MIYKVVYIIKNFRKIASGVSNWIFPSQYVEKIAAHRLAICESNECRYYDKKGESAKAYIKGKPTCAQCGCALNWKSRSLSSYCSLKDEGKTPLWDVEMTEKQEREWRDKTGIKNDPEQWR